MQQDFSSLFNKYQTLALITFNALFLWGFFSYVRINLNSPDMFENYVWGMAWTLGNNKHPPLFGWITALWFEFFPTKAWAYYVLDELNLFVALLFLRKAMLEFVNEEKVFIAIALTIVTLSLGVRKGWEYNANIAQLPFLTGYMWALIKAYKFNKKKYLILAGLFAGASILCKYSAVLLLASITIGVWLCIQPNIKKIISTSTFISLLALLMLIPHFIWEIQHNFPSLQYMHHGAQLESSQSLTRLIAERVILSFNFTIVSLVMFTLALLHQFSLFGIKIGHISRGAIGFNIYALSITSILLGAIIEGLKPDLGWFIVGTIFVGWALVDILPADINWHRFSMDITALLGIYFIGLALYGFYKSEQLKSHNMLIEAVPEILSKEVTNSFHAHYHQRIEYAGGTFPFAYALAFYSEDHPYSIYRLDLPGSPWLNENKFLHDSKVIICGDQRRLVPIEPNCSQEAVKKFGIPNDQIVITYQAFDPISKSKVTLNFKVLMYQWGKSGQAG